MAFIDDIVDVITGDSSINSLVTGGMRYGFLPTDFDNSKNWIVFSHTLQSEDKTLDGYTTSIYNLETQITSPSEDNLLAIWNLLKPYLTSYDDGSKIRYINIEDEDKDYDTQKQMHFITANYTAFYNG
jgi:hypothetical protein